MIINQLFSNMWDLYSRINPQVIKVKKMFDERENKNVANDHIAIRTFNRPRVNRNVIAKSFLESGYEAHGDLCFDTKKLDATYYGHHDKNLTRVFISELRLEDFSEKLQKTINILIDQIPDKIINQYDFCNSGISWDVINHETYTELKEESEYAAWVATFGFMVNHFTISINDCNTFSSLNEVNSFLKENGYRINDSGGDIKGSVEHGLEQSSILAESIPVQFNPIESSPHDIPGCYYEFALRHNNFDGFIAGSADKIFESTDNK